MTWSPTPSVGGSIDAAARAEFSQRYGTPVLGPVCIVIAVYREAGTLAAVVGRLPGKVWGHEARVLVVDDGSDDRTAEVARDAGASVCRTAVNRGQGAALRLGYAVAHAHDAAYIVTTDADGQYDPCDIPKVLAPILAGEADFVSGSRRLGSTYRGDDFRRLGVVVYAALMSVLTRTRITDPSFGLRAMRSAVPLSLQLDEPQYQAAELLIGAAMRGFRIAEVPATMHKRVAGRSSKGHDVLYGARFGRVVFSTWWRERRRRAA